MISLSDIKEYKNFIVAGAIIIMIVFVGYKTNSWYENKLSEAFNNGVVTTDAKWKKVQEESNKKVKKYKDGQTIKVDELGKTLAENAEKIAFLQKQLEDKSFSYMSKESSKVSCLDEDFVDIYNQSLGNK